MSCLRPFELSYNVHYHVLLERSRVHGIAVLHTSAQSGCRVVELSGCRVWLLSCRTPTLERRRNKPLKTTSRL